MIILCRIFIFRIFYIQNFFLLAVIKETKDLKNAIMDVEKREPLFTVGGIVNWSVWRILKKLKIELSYDPATSPLGIYLKETKTLTQKDT